LRALIESGNVDTHKIFDQKDKNGKKPAELAKKEAKETIDTFLEGKYFILKREQEEKLEEEAENTSSSKMRKKRR